MTWHTTRYWVNGIFHVNAFGFQHILQLVTNVLGLSHCQTISRYDDHLRCVFHHNGNIGCLHLSHTSTRCTGCASTPIATCHSNQYVHQRAIHRFAHHNCKNGTGRTYQYTTHQHHLILVKETTTSGSHTSKRVQQRNHHRHVGTPNWEHKQQTINDGQTNRYKEIQRRMRGIKFTIIDVSHTQNRNQNHRIDNLLRRETEIANFTIQFTPSHD